MEPVTLRFLDQAMGNDVVPNLLVSVYDELGTELVLYGRTTSTGVLEFEVDPGSYIVRTFKLGISPTEEVLEVSSGGGSFTFFVSTILTSPPPGPRVCRLYANFVLLDGTPSAGFRVNVQNLFDPMAGLGLAVTEKSFDAEADDVGHVEFDVVRGARIRVTFLTTPLTREIVVPDKNIENLMTAMGLSTDPFQVVRR